MISCPKCQNSHHLHDCPIIKKEILRLHLTPHLKQEFSGAAPNVFIGHYGYPHLNVGILSPVQSSNAWLYDAPRYWAQQDFSVNDIIGYRTGLVNSRFLTNVKGTSRMVELVKEVGMAQKPVDVDVSLKDKPTFRLSVNSFTSPNGPKGMLDNAVLTSNPYIDRKVDKVVSDTDWKASSSMKFLYDKGYDEVFLTKLLSVGNMGVKIQRKIVPTKWSIVATDDMISKHVTENVKQFEKTNFLAFFGGYLGNFYLALCFPDVWSYELFEMYVPTRVNEWSKQGYNFATDYEDFEGRKKYAFETVGGWYASKLAVVEKLDKMKKQGTVIVFRFITPEYTLPLGVFVVREAMRKCMASTPIEFESRDLMLTYSRHLVKKKFGVELDGLLKYSKILKRIKEQSKLTTFFS